VSSGVKKHGGEQAQENVFFTRDEGLLAMMPSPEVVKRGLEVKLDRGGMDD
jgi:hypothetical protein